MATISKNLLWSAVTSLLQIYTGSVIFIVLAKLMPIEDFGILSFGFSLATIVWVFADFGLSLMIMKDYPLHEKIPHKYLTNAFVFKFLISTVVGIFCLGYLFLLYDLRWTSVGLIFVIFAIQSSFVIYLQSLLKIQNKFGKFAQTSIVYAIGISVTILIYWLTNINLLLLSLCICLCKGIQLLWVLFMSRNYFDKKFIDKKQFKYFIKNSWSFGLHTILGILYFMIDTQIISIYLGAQEVALYQSAFRVILIFLMFSEMLSSVLLPYLSYKYANNEEISQLISQLILYLCLIGCSIFLFLSIFRESIIGLLYTSEYTEAVPLLIPLSFVIVIRTICSLLGNILTISHHQYQRVITVFGALAVSVIFNMLLIPRFGIQVAAWVNVLAHLTLFTMYYIFVKKIFVSNSLFSGESFSVIIVTSIIFIFNLCLADYKWLVAGISIVIWLSFIIYLMKLKNNFIFLKNLLKDRGIST